MNDWSVIFETDQRYRAEILRGLLEENGIEAVILDQKDSSYQAFGWIKIWVRNEDQEKAASILKSMYRE